MLNPDVVVSDPNNTMAIPCGLNARSTFDDSYKLFRCPKENPKCTLEEGGTEIPINRTNIIFPSDNQGYHNIDLQAQRNIKAN